ncbi:MAG: 50S ribosomal protein L21e [Candidatus Diapherotrites archaeon]
MANKKAKGVLAKTRAKRKGPKVTPNKLLFPYEIGDYVDIKIDPSVSSGRPHRRYDGLTGRIVAKQGNCFYVEVSKLGKVMRVLCGTAHLKLSRGVVREVKAAEVLQ